MKRLDGTYMKKNILVWWTIRLAKEKGLGIGGTKEESDAWYVVGKDLKTNTLYVEPGFIIRIYIQMKLSLQMSSGEVKKTSGEMTAKFRYRQQDHPVQVQWIDDTNN